MMELNPNGTSADRTRGPALNRALPNLSLNHCFCFGFFWILFFPFKILGLNRYRMVPFPLLDYCLSPKMCFSHLVWMCVSILSVRFPLVF